jgi:hypothetical protein
MAACTADTGNEQDPEAGLPDFFWYNLPKWEKYV